MSCSLRLLCLGFLLCATACAINPATGKRELVLIGESQEIALGRESDASVKQDMGLYGDEELQRYVETLGRRLAAVSERPDLEWHFEVVDDPTINAFALPGGYIYVTRGILAHLENEAELASVLGHEIGHVTARHSVTQMSKAQITQLGMGLGAVLAPETMSRLGGLAQTGLSALFMKYSRDDERQADDLGLRYLVRAGYDPRPMPDVFAMLGRVSAAAGAGRVPAWMSTHPAPENRERRMSDAIAALGQDFSSRPTDREAFLDRLEDVTFGDDPRQGYFRATTFLHPGLRFRLDFPAGWKLANRRTSVAAQSEGGNAAIELTLSGKPTAQAALDEFFAEPGITRTGPAMGSIRGLTTAGSGFVVALEQGALEGRVGFVELDGRVFRLLGYAEQSAWDSLGPTIRSTLGSFDRLTDPAVLAAVPGRLRLVTPTSSVALEDLARRNGATAPIETLALLNRLEPQSKVLPGRRYKLVVGRVAP